MATLFDGLPDTSLVVQRTGLSEPVVRDALLEMAFVCKTITRLDKGYVLGEHEFCRPGSAAERALGALDSPSAPAPDEAKVLFDRWWIDEHNLAVTVANRRGLTTDMTATLVAELVHQLDSGIDAGGMKVAAATLELEAVVEQQLLTHPEVLAAWGWDLDPASIRSQVRLDAENRADIIGRHRDGRWVIIELKRRAALDDVADQIARYLDRADVVAHGEPVVGLVIADGADAVFHDRVAQDGHDVTYLPTRALNLPACRPQNCHLLPPPGVLYDAAPGFELGRVPFAIAADGATLVDERDHWLRGCPDPEDRWTKGLDLCTGEFTAEPVPKLRN